MSSAQGFQLPSLPSSPSPLPASFVNKFCGFCSRPQEFLTYNLDYSGSIQISVTLARLGPTIRGIL